MGGGLALSFGGNTFLNLNKTRALFIEEKRAHVLVKQNACAFLNTTMSACYVTIELTTLLIIPILLLFYVPPPLPSSP